MKVLVCGSRDWTKIEPIREQLSKLPKDTIIIHGAARGADTIAGAVAKELGFQVKEYPADWKKHGRAAGPLRNKLMLDDNPDIGLVIAFHEDILNSKGTRDMLERTNKKPITVISIRE